MWKKPLVAAAMASLSLVAALWLVSFVAYLAFNLWAVLRS